MTSTEIRDYFSDSNIVAEIVHELNTEIGFCPILRNLKREKDSGVIDNESITFRELGVEDRNEVFVYLGRILESVLTCQLAKCDSFDVKKDRSSSGDVTINGRIWEIKGTSGKNSWTGSTHASKKEDDKMDFIGIKYGLNEDINVFDIFTGNASLLEEIFIGVFDQIELIRRGTATQSNSRTSLLIGIDEYDVVKEQIAWGWLKKPQRNGKYLQLCAA